MAKIKYKIKRTHGKLVQWACHTMDSGILWYEVLKSERDAFMFSDSSHMFQFLSEHLWRNSTAGKYTYEIVPVVEVEYVIYCINYETKESVWVGHDDTVYTDIAKIKKFTDPKELTDALAFLVRSRMIETHKIRVEINS